MKRSATFTALTALIVGVASLSGAQAVPTYSQNTLGTTLTASATVGADISVVGTPFTFGSIYRNKGPYTLDPKSNNAGFFTIQGTGGSTVTVNMTDNGPLTSFSTGGSLPVVYSYSSVGAGTGVCTASPFAATSSFNLSGIAGASGSGKVCVGGQVSPVSGTTNIATDYTGVVTISVVFP